MGDVFEVPLGDGMHGYGHVLEPVLIGIYDVCTDSKMRLEDVIVRGVAFRVNCLMERLTSGDWPIVGQTNLPPAMSAPARFWRMNSPDFIFLQEWRPETGSDERRVTREEIVGLEQGGLWQSRDVEERLRLFLRGQPCPWVKLG